MEEYPKLKKYVSELMKGPTDLWALLGTVLSVFGFLALIGYKPNSSGLSFLVGIYSTFFESPWIWLSTILNLEMREITTDFLAWFTVLLGLHIRGARMGFYRLTIEPYHDQADWTLFTMAVLMPFLLATGTESNLSIWLWVLFFVLYSISLNIFRAIQIRSLKHFKISQVADEISKGWKPLLMGVATYVFAVAVVGNVIWSIDLANVPGIDTEAGGLFLQIFSAATFMMWLYFLIPIFAWLILFAFFFNAYLLVSIPRILSSTVLLLVVIVVGDQLIGPSTSQ